MYLNFMFLDQFVFELLRKNTHTHTDAHKDSDEHKVAFCENGLKVAWFEGCIGV